MVGYIVKRITDSSLTCIRFLALQAENVSQRVPICSLYRKRLAVGADLLLMLENLVVGADLLLRIEKPCCGR